MRWLDNSITKFDANHDVFLSEVLQLRVELSDFGEVVSNERLATITLNALSEEKYSTIELQSIRDPDLGLEEIISMMKTIFINHSEKSSVPERSQAPYRKRYDSGRKSTTNSRELAVATVITCHKCKRPEHEIKIAIS